MYLQLWVNRLKELYKHSPTYLLASWFAVFLVLGTILLAIPPAQRPDGPGLGILGALFTATSAFCVTGLTLTDTQATFTIFGQAVLLCLIELGGLGIMTFASLGFSLLGRRLSLVSQAALTDSLFQNNPAQEFRNIFRSMLKAVLGIQIIGAGILYYSLIRQPVIHHPEPVDPLWSALFHSVSAFCNAGFAIYRDNLIPVAGNRLFLAVICVLVIFGGLGHGVLAELYRLPKKIRQGIKKPHLLSLNSRISLRATLILLVLGAFSLGLVAVFLDDNGALTVEEAVFHSIVARTAGFATAHLDGIPLPSCLLLCLLMFIGGSPGSCAGGIKTTSLTIWIARLAGKLRQDEKIVVMGFSIPDAVAGRARLIMALSGLWVLFGVLLLSVSQPGARLDILLFEQISAFATVGLSMDYTPHLNWLSQVWIILSMIFGKFGPLTIALAMIHPASGKISRPAGQVMIG